ncbi:hypothetical protein RND71_011669 [Anisodus tanguticus]|uniref:Uncharacterized protein n=1 Tax=Anisodus tanguticus TaxID=243964 RepID=A0AAE1SE67_9SOLA|nr:hypothetical protein RND71_011669 [Anisodus tanguticus]
MALIVLFISKTPLRKLVIMGRDCVKRGRGPIVFKTTSDTIFIVMLSTLYGMVSIRKRWINEDDVFKTFVKNIQSGLTVLCPTDDVIKAFKPKFDADPTEKKEGKRKWGGDYKVIKKYGNWKWGQGYLIR